MVHVTHKSCLKLVGAALLVVATFVGVGISGAVQAQSLPYNVVEQSAVKQAVVAARCGILASAMELDQNILNLYYAKVQGYEDNAEVVYEAGYTMGILDASVYFNVHGYATFEETRMAAATLHYARGKCAPYESI